MAASADALVLLTEWPQYQDLNWEKLAGSMRSAILLDARNALDRARLTRAGLIIYAAGSDPVAAFRSGVNVRDARAIAYLFSGLACAIGGMALTMTTGIGAPLAGVYYTLSGLAAVVVGGVSLAGGRGGMVGPILAAFVLTLIPTDLIFLNIDPNFGQVIQGTLIVVIVMIGAFVERNRR